MLDCHNISKACKNCGVNSDCEMWLGYNLGKKKMLKFFLANLKPMFTELKGITTDLEDGIVELENELKDL